MTIGIEIVSNVTEVMERIEGGMPKGMEKGMLRAAEFVVGEIRREIFDKFPDGRTGELARSYKAQLLKSGKKVVAGALSDLVYAGIQDRGGTINAKGKMLAIPVGKGRLLPVGTGPRDVPGLSLIKGKGAEGGLLAKVKKNGKMDVYFVLRSSVTLKGRKYLEAAREKSKDTVKQVLEESVQEVIDDAGGGT